MKNGIKLSGLVLTALFWSSCSAVEGIFKAGMGFGILIVVGVILIVAVIAIRSNKK